MPREQIVFPRVPLDSDDPRIPVSERAQQAPVPHVCWHGAPESGGWVQLMFGVDREFLELLLADLPKDQHYIELHSEVLDRGATNRLIKHTRRARNAAYGVDE